jgi:MFS family permease
VRWKELVLEGAQVSKTALGVRGLLALLLSAFGIFGLWSGYAVVLLVDLSGALDLSPGPLSVALLIGTVASLAAMPALGWTADRLGRKVFLVAVTCVWGTGIAGLALTGDFWTLVLVLLFLSPSTGLYDIGINAAAVDLERLSRRRYLSFLHATYSGGALVGTLVAGALLSAGVGYRLVYLSLLVPLGMLVLAFAVVRFPSPDGTSRDTTGGAGSGAEPELGEHSREGRWELYRSAPLLLIAAIAALGLMAEGLMETWSGIYLRDWLGRETTRQPPDPARGRTPHGCRDDAGARGHSPRGARGLRPLSISPKDHVGWAPELSETRVPGQELERWEEWRFE